MSRRPKKPKNNPLDSVGGGAGSTGPQNRNAGVSSILDRNVKTLPSIIWSFRNGRKSSVGYDEPTYFGFAIDIHSQPAEAEGVFNPYTGLRANPLFYQPAWAELPADGSGKMQPNSTDDAFPELTSGANEANAIQYLNSYSLPLSNDADTNSAKGLLLKTKADSLTQIKLDQEYGGLASLNRGYYLMEFIKILNNIQDKTPWVMKELEGIQNLWKATQPEYDFKPIDLTITTDESVDLRITKLADTYRRATYDSFNGRKILAPNLEKFSMDVYLMDMRFIKDGLGDGLAINLGLNSPASYDESFSAQVSFGGIAFRCVGCSFDFSKFFDQTTSYKNSIGDSNFQPKIGIKVDRVIPATYFGDKSFGTAGFSDESLDIPGFAANALNGALNLGPFTGGVTRVLDAGRRALTNILGTPQRALNDALLGVQRRFDGAVDNFLGNSRLSSRPFEKKSAESLINERNTGQRGGDRYSDRTDAQVLADRRTSPINFDRFPGSNSQVLLDRKAPPIVNDMFPGVDVRPTAPITTDVFPGVDSRKARPIRSDVFPGSSQVVLNDREARPINGDVFPGDVPIMKTINQRKFGGKIFSPNPLKP